MLNLISWVFYGIPLQENEDLQFESPFLSIMIITLGLVSIVFVLELVLVSFLALSGQLPLAQ